MLTIKGSSCSQKPFSAAKNWFAAHRSSTASVNYTIAATLIHMRSYYTDLDRASGGQLLLFWVLVSKARIIDPNIQAILPRTPLRLGWRVAKEGRTLAKTEKSSLLVKLPSRMYSVLAFFMLPFHQFVYYALGFWVFFQPSELSIPQRRRQNHSAWLGHMANGARSRLLFPPALASLLERPIRWADPSCSCETLRCFFFWKDSVVIDM